MPGPSGGRLSRYWGLLCRRSGRSGGCIQVGCSPAGGAHTDISTAGLLHLIEKSAMCVISNLT